MSHALRLVRGGDLKQAMAVIQQGLRADAPRVDVIDEPVPDAAPATPAGQRFESLSHTSQAGTRQYRLFVPASYRDEPLPLVVMLHGCTQTPEDFAAGTRMNDLGAEYGFFVAYPAQASAANPKKCWNWFKRSEQQRERGEPSLIAGIVDDLRSRYAIDERRVFVAGLSSGGAMAATLAATYPDVFAAVGVHSGLAHGCAHDLPSALAAMRGGSAGVAVRGIPTIVFHGDQDALVHPRNGEEVAAQWMSGKEQSTVIVDSALDANGYGYTRRSVHAASPPSRLEHWVIHGAGHAWSGGSPSGTHTDPKGPDASREMVRFFFAEDALATP
ncbi:MAG TPA: PHB depolymerase family esterase [Usitatibacter sp.]|nr:PHB depolymerase family esterase [Usitatibacter sp.]